MHELQALLAIASRDLKRLLRDRPRMAASLIFPLVFIVALGGSLQASLGKNVGFDFRVFIFTGVLAQTLFQSTASGIISLIEDRTNNFSQEMFVSPISRYTLIFGKILGETLVSLVQCAAIIIFAVIIGIPFSLATFISLLPFFFIICFLGGAFGVLILSNLNAERTANQIFPFVMFPQIFLSGVFSPIKHLPVYLHVVSRLMPMTYAIDLLRTVYYRGQPEAVMLTAHSFAYNLMVVIILTFVFILIGTFLFVKNETER